MHVPLPPRWQLRTTLAVTALLILSVTTAIAQRAGPQSAFAEANNIAMATMMRGMDIKPSGDIDRDFATMMIAHHRGAIDMALAQLRYGSNEQLRRIAQGIVVEQQQEIAAMSLAIGRQLPPAPASQTPLALREHH